MQTYRQILITLFVIITICFLYVDRSAAWWYHSHLPLLYQHIFNTITEFGDSLYYLLGFPGTYLLFRYRLNKPQWAHISLLLFTTVAASGIFVNVIKVFIGRYRPRELFDQDLYGFDFFHFGYAMTSFPSGHTTTVFALATVIAYLWPKWRIPVLFWAILVGISRIAVGAHYPSDVIAGAAAGVFSSLVLLSYWNPDFGFHQKSNRVLT